MAHPFVQAARLRQAGEYEDAGENTRFVPGPRSEYARIRRLCDDLVAGYRGRAFEDVFCGREVICSAGGCWVLESREAMDLDGRDPGRAAAAILSDLTLVHGIGRVTERRLKGRGYRTVADLVRHPRYHDEAARLLDSVTEGNVRDISDLIGRRHHRSDPLLLEASRFHAPGDFVFLDIETLGLFSRPIILIGLARVEGGSITTRQYLLRSVVEEAAALTAVLPTLEAEGAVLVTFNGRAFDLPYIRERLGRHGIPAGLDMPHVDVLHFARRRWGDSLATCRLGALETAVLGLARENDLPGSMVPEFYDIYRRTGNPGPLVPVVEHNRQDLISLARLFALLRGDGNGGTIPDALR
ncbi:ribonuclease H-like domain-containing protein [Methanoculleus sp.]|uniref:ribonuclease H-like domain-containing protein n=1 Tax=Methanoculleus sp. TaxID=90427 RepID=UPI0025CBC17E|nr:ribonuclease H-like domain-containing protein [Methanoculleus sp.]